jgi:ribonuclease-3
VHRLVDPLLRSSAELGAGLDWKTSLQELTATASLGVPEYAVTEEGPDHAKLFHAVAIVQNRECGSGSGRSKKEAEQSAAAAAFQRLQAEIAAAEAAAAQAEQDSTAERAEAGAD